MQRKENKSHYLIPKYDTFHSRMAELQLIWTAINEKPHHFVRVLRMKWKKRQLVTIQFVKRIQNDDQDDSMIDEKSLQVSLKFKWCWCDRSLDAVHVM